MSDDNNTEILLDANDLGRRYGRHPNTIIEWASKGIIPQGILIAPNTRRWTPEMIKKFERERAKAAPARAQRRRRRGGA